MGAFVGSGNKFYINQDKICSRMWAQFDENFNAG
jgi:hypothetical protein